MSHPPHYLAFDRALDAELKRSYEDLLQSVMARDPFEDIVFTIPGRPVRWRRLREARRRIALAWSALRGVELERPHDSWDE